MKVALIAIGILILTIVILFIIISNKKNKIKEKQNEINDLNFEVQDLENRLNKLKGELEIEKKYSKILAEKLENIGCMSIDDILHELQNDSKDGLLYT